jgi:hypothetical protein
MLPRGLTKSPIGELVPDDTFSVAEEVDSGDLGKLSCGVLLLVLFEFGDIGVN